MFLSTVAVSSIFRIPEALALQSSISIFPCQSSITAEILSVVRSPKIVTVQVADVPLNAREGYTSIVLAEAACAEIARITDITSNKHKNRFLITHHPLSRLSNTMKGGDFGHLKTLFLSFYDLHTLGHCNQILNAQKARDAKRCAFRRYPHDCSCSTLSSRCNRFSSNTVYCNRLNR